MASIYDLKPRFQALLKPLCAWLANRAVTANQVTLAALIMSMLYGLALAANPGARALLFLAPIVFLLRMALNAIDGMLARDFGQKSALGAILNELSDVVADAAIYLPFALIAGAPAGLVTIAVMLGVIAEMTGVLGVMIGAERQYQGPFGKSDRAFFFGAIALALAIGVAPDVWMNIAFVIAIMLGVMTIANRIRAALQEQGKGRG